METQERKRFVIDRKNWYRGLAYSALRRAEDGKMCCLGFICKQSGIEDANMTNIGGPDSLAQRAKRKVEFFFPPDWLIGQLPWVTEAIAINDASHLSEAHREALLMKLFAEHNIDLVFEN